MHMHTQGEQPSSQQPKLGFYEVCMLQLVAWFVVNYWWGCRENARIKDAWCVRSCVFVCVWWVEWTGSGGWLVDALCVRVEIDLVGRPIDGFDPSYPIVCNINSHSP
jgi:hypothetical protein